MNARRSSRKYFLEKKRPAKIKLSTRRLFGFEEGKTFGLRQKEQKIFECKSSSERLAFSLIFAGARKISAILVPLYIIQRSDDLYIAGARRSK